MSEETEVLDATTETPPKQAEETVNETTEDEGSDDTGAGTE